MKELKKGMPIYSENPSIEKAIKNENKGVKKITSPIKGKDNKNLTMYNSTTGEIIAEAGVAFVQHIEVDKEAFVKLFIQGISAFSGLTKPGTKVFEMVIIEAKNNIGKDKIFLSPRIAQDLFFISKTTYTRGILNLVQKEILFNTEDTNWYFININYIFNGDRIAFLKTYKMKKYDENLIKIENEKDESKYPKLPL